MDVLTSGALQLARGLAGVVNYYAAALFHTRAVLVISAIIPAPPHAFSAHDLVPLWAALNALPRVSRCDVVSRARVSPAKPHRTDLHEMPARGEALVCPAHKTLATVDALPHSQTGGGEVARTAPHADVAPIRRGLEGPGPARWAALPRLVVRELVRRALLHAVALALVQPGRAQLDTVRALLVVPGFALRFGARPRCVVLQTAVALRYDLLPTLTRRIVIHPLRNAVDTPVPVALVDERPIRRALEIANLRAILYCVHPSAALRQAVLKVVVAHIIRCRAAIHTHFETAFAAKYLLAGVAICGGTLAIHNRAIVNAVLGEEHAVTLVALVHTPAVLDQHGAAGTAACSILLNNIGPRGAIPDTSIVVQI